MPLTVGAADQGTTESDWLAHDTLSSCPVLALGSPARVVVLAPHPDDEVLAVGGTLRILAAAGSAISVLAVTDGEASHPGSTVYSREELASIRAAERKVALERLGLRAAEVTRLGCPDGGVARVDDLADRLAPLLSGAALCFAPWMHDGHPDHDATGVAAALVCMRMGVRLLEYPVWAWHWGRPEGRDLPLDRARRVPLEARLAARKRRAIAAYHSQVEPLGPAAGDGPVLPPFVLARFVRAFETVFV